MAITDCSLSKSIINIFLKEFPLSLFMESKITFGKYGLVAVTNKQCHNFPFCLITPLECDCITFLLVPDPEALESMFPMQLLNFNYILYVNVLL